MNSWSLYGHDWAVEHLRRGLRNGRVRHAYLFTGAERIGKTTMALLFAMTLNCTSIARDESGSPLDPRPCGECSSCRRMVSGNHPDLIWAARESGSAWLKIEEVRAAAKQLALKPFEARYRIAIFPEFDRAQPRAQDALLKTLEEPPPRALLLLVTAAPEAILPTISSRSQVVRLRPLAVEEVRLALLERGADAPQAALLARLSAGRIGWALEALAQPDLLAQRAEALDILERLLALGRAGRFALAEGLSKDKPALAALLELWQSYWRDLLLMGSGADLGAAVVNIDRESALRQLASRLPRSAALAALQATQAMLRLLLTNANPRLGLEAMLLDYPHVEQA
jgi:DNA polymerase-3 subunit delta'